ncbi:hypothetical protein ACLOJK_001476 [Asimina triloba]
MSTLFIALRLRTPLHHSGVLLVIPDNIVAPHSDPTLYSPRLRFWGVRHFVPTRLLLILERMQLLTVYPATLLMVLWVNDLIIELFDGSL